MTDCRPTASIPTTGTKMGPTTGKAGLLIVSSAISMLVGSAAFAQSQSPASQGSGNPAPIGTVRVEGEGTAGGFTIQPPADKGYAAERMTSATKTDTPLRDVPQSVAVVTRDQIRDQDIRGIGEAVRYVPGVSIAQGEGNRDTPIFRGNSSTADFFVDGVRDDVQFFRDLYNIERVEVLKGPNAMIFGRGGAGGVINRVTKQADWNDTRELLLQGGSYENLRGSADLGAGLSDNVAVRVTGVYEDSESYRDDVELERWGVNPTASFRLGADTLLTLGYEHFSDERTADRGIPSFNGRPVDVDESTFFGDPDRSISDADVDSLTAAIEHQFGNGIILRNRLRYADYSKFYQNVFPGAVTRAPSGELQAAISAYSNETQRENIFNQTDLTFYADTGPVSHTLLAGVELGRQETDNVRLTGFFASPVNVPIANPRTNAPLTFRPSATDANNHGVAKQAAVYLQDQISFSPQFQAVLGLRYDRFEVDFRNNRTGAEFAGNDDLVSPRVGLIYKPAEPVSLYASYSLSYVPRAGEQLASLTLTNQALDPEKFTNYELGAKWDIRPDLALTAAIYQLDRSNVAIADPADPARSLLVDGQRTRGFELGLTGNLTEAWSIIAAYAYQDGELTATASPTARDGARLAQLPKHSVAVWNRYDFSPMWGVGLGVIHQGDRFTSTDNQVTLPDFTRFDGALFFTLNENLRAQVNVENLFNEDYALNAHSNNNISPGSPRAFRVSLLTRF